MRSLITRDVCVCVWGGGGGATFLLILAIKRRRSTFRNGPVT